MSGTISNGARAPVTFGAFAGEAGVQERLGGEMEVAFRAEIRALRGVTAGVIDGQAVEVIAVAKSEFVPGMVVLTCRPVAGG